MRSDPGTRRKDRGRGGLGDGGELLMFQVQGPHEEKPRLDGAQVRETSETKCAGRGAGSGTARKPSAREHSNPGRSHFGDCLSSSSILA